MCLSSLVPTDLYSLSLPDALPISLRLVGRDTRDRVGNLVTQVGLAREAVELDAEPVQRRADLLEHARRCTGDRKSTRLNSSHQINSYAVFCLKKNQKNENQLTDPS